MNRLEKVNQIVSGKRGEEFVRNLIKNTDNKLLQELVLLMVDKIGLEVQDILMSQFTDDDINRLYDDMFGLSREEKIETILNVDESELFDYIDYAGLCIQFWYYQSDEFERAITYNTDMWMLLAEFFNPLDLINGVYDMSDLRQEWNDEYGSGYDFYSDFIKEYLSDEYINELYDTVINY